MISKKALIAGVALALALTGCGSKNEGANAGANEAAIQQDQQQQAPPDGNGGPGMMNRAPVDLFGKVKSIDGNTITVYKSSFNPGQGGGNGGMRQRRNGDGQQQADGQQLAPPADGQLPADGQQPPAGDGTNGNPGGGRGQMNFDNMFTDETVDITVTDSTKIIKREFVDNQMKETELTLADLKADDIVSIDLTDGTQEAATISLGMGGFGGGGGFGGRGGMRGQGGQQGGQGGGQDQSSPQAQQQ